MQILLTNGCLGAVDLTVITHSERVFKLNHIWILKNLLGQWSLTHSSDIASETEDTKWVIRSVNQGNTDCNDEKKTDKKTKNDLQDTT